MEPLLRPDELFLMEIVPEPEILALVLCRTDPGHEALAVADPLRDEWTESVITITIKARERQRVANCIFWFVVVVVFLVKKYSVCLNDFIGASETLFLFSPIVN